MEVKGMVFRAAKTGPNKGQLTVPVAGTKRTAYVTKDEMRAFDVPPNAKLKGAINDATTK
jgi:hypothetical protein